MKTFLTNALQKIHLNNTRHVQLPKYLSFVSKFDLFNPTREHLSLRNTVRQLVETVIDQQAVVHNRSEQFNMDLFQKFGDLGLLGVTVDPEYGGSGMDAVASVIIFGKLLNTLFPVLKLFRGSKC